MKIKTFQDGELIPLKGLLTGDAIASIASGKVPEVNGQAVDRDTALNELNQQLHKNLNVINRLMKDPNLTREDVAKLRELNRRCLDIRQKLVSKRRLKYVAMAIVNISIAIVSFMVLQYGFSNIVLAAFLAIASIIPSLTPFLFSNGVLFIFSILITSLSLSYTISIVELLEKENWKPSQSEIEKLDNESKDIAFKLKEIESALKRI